ncbi:beta-ketoacyl synthase N-terminal-like domain-containing protein [Burkholderia gladioli]|uniref:Putative polyketide synthase n=1 Tax=Burkholderia gladioli (strain BSR3) TaxID=999541 RepID=F2LSV7_BURGS|nr:beta-ketoacyl synthase N-terminal-like domain-containing protein [Burkholderia gladioli]AEA65977.1 putative polyketide synthase [Burkholderia gladioli BSR3]MBW5286921.1 KR domain-containing protein [Burkholderia gladioli]
MTAFSTDDFQQRYGDTLPIAVIGAGCRMPRADDIFEYWRRLADGETLIERFDAERLAAAGVDPALLARGDYVPCAAVVERAERFDWSFFGYSRQEAESIDPQQRIFLMCAWEALELAGYPPSRIETLGHALRIGVLGACKMSSYPAARLDNSQDIASPRTFGRLIGNDKDYLATRVSYKLGLTGPSLTVQTACSSSLVAIHLACEQLASGECDMVLAGGAGIGFPQENGYFHHPGMIFSPDGHCRPFDADANGTAIGNGAAVVLLKPLARALADGDPVLAVVRGSSVNNDGRGKTGYTAPAPQGQTRVIADALAMAEVDPASIGMVEAHGTATPLGDPIEVEALSRAWREHTAQTGYCALGSVKSNLGHLDTAAGVASFLKTALALHYGQVPPSLNFRRPNPAIDFAASPFFVPQVLLPWPIEDGPRRAAVSAFAIGGTNCHAILEQAPVPDSVPAAASPVPRAGPYALLLSARSETALRTLALRHARRLADPDAAGQLADYCATSLHHRSLFEQRLLLVAHQADALADWLEHFARGDEARAQPAGTAPVVPVQVPADDTVPARCCWSAAADTREDSLALLAQLREALEQPTPDWQRYPQTRHAPLARRLLPTCPFEGERCWFEAPVARAVPAAPAALATDTPAAAPAASARWLPGIEAGRRASIELARELDLSNLAREAEGVDALHGAYVSEALRQLGLFAEPEAWLDVDACLRQGGIAAAHRDLLARLLRDLAASGRLEAGEIEQRAHYRRLRGPGGDDTRVWLAAMRELGYSQLALLVERAGPALADMLAGRVDPVGVVFPRAATDEVEHMYQDQAYSVYLNGIAAAAAAAIAASGRDRPLRILEVGGGTGGTTRDLLAQLPEGTCERYTFTDVGPLFLLRARAKFAAYPFMHYQGFDMNAPAHEQGLEAGGYDLIVAANVLHNAPSLRRMLANLGSLLAPGGMLLMREITHPKKLFDFVFGPLVPPLDDIRERHGELFASEAVWRDALADAGFVEVAALPSREQPTAALGEQILIARWPCAMDPARAAGAGTASTPAGPTSRDEPLAAPGGGFERAAHSHRPGAILAAVMADLPERAGLLLADGQWHVDPRGAPLPLRLRARVGADRLEVELLGQTGPRALFSATLRRPRALPVGLHEPSASAPHEAQTRPPELAFEDDEVSSLDAALADPSARHDSGGAPFAGFRSLYWPLPDRPGMPRRLCRGHDGVSVLDAARRVVLRLEPAATSTALPAPWREADATSDGELYQWQWSPLDTVAPLRAPQAIQRMVWIMADGSRDWPALSEALDGRGLSGIFRPLDTLPDEASALRDWLATKGRLDALCYVPPRIDADDPHTAVERLEAAWRPLVVLLEALAGISDPPRLAVLAQHAFAPGDQDLADNWQAAGLGGLLSVARQEYPRLSTLLLDPGDAAAADALPALLTLWAAADPVPVAALRDGQLRVQQLVPAAQPRAPGVSRGGRHVLIGGLCELGLELAEHLADQGASRLDILARREPNPAQAARLLALRERGLGVVVDSRADAADPTAFAASLARLDSGTPIDAVFHLAGVVHDAPLAAMLREPATTRHERDRALATKLVPALMLHAWEMRLRPALSVYFSSAASAFGPAGQGSHALANAWLEGLAQHRSRLGLDTLALAWGYWGEIEAVHRRALASRLAERGMLGMSTARGLAMLDAALAGTQSFYLPCRVDWQRFAAAATPAQALRFGACWPGSARAAAPLREDDTPGRGACEPILATGAGHRADPPRPAEAGRPDNGAPATHADLYRRVRAHIAELLGRAPDAIPGQANLVQLGLDSLLFLYLSEKLSQEFGISVSAETAFKASTLDALVAALENQLGSAAGPAPALDALAPTGSPGTASLAVAPGGAAGQDDTTADAAGDDIGALVAALKLGQVPRRPIAARYLRRRLAQLLQRDEQGIDEARNLVQIGLDSLMFLELGETIERDLGVRLSAQAAFQAGNFGALIDGLAQSLGGDPAPAAEAAHAQLRDALAELEQADGGWLAPHGDVLPRPVPAETPLALPGLRALRWRLRDTDLAQQLYVEYDKPAEFPLDAFERAWNRLVARHPMLRATIDADGALQVLPSVPTYRFTRCDWRGRPRPERDAALAQWREAMSMQAPDLRHWPHFDWRASRLDETGLRLHLRIDTTLVDIESLRIMLRELHLMMLDAERPLPSLGFSARDYYATEAALGGTPAHARVARAYAAQLAALPPAPSLPPRRDAAGPDGPRLLIWRDALAGDAWQALKAQARQAGLSGTAVLLAAYALALAPWADSPTFSLRLDYPDRKPMHAHATNVMLDASASALVPCRLEAESFTALARDCALAIDARLRADLLDSAELLAAYGRQQPGQAHRAPLPPVAMTSLLGVRTTYAIPETSDPLLGMPSYEYASQPATWLHLQVLEEASALLYNIDQRADRLPEELGETVMLRLGLILDALSRTPDAWRVDPMALVPADTEIQAYAAELRRAESADWSGAPAAAATRATEHETDEEETHRA